MPNWHIKCGRWTACATLCIPEQGVAMFSSVLSSPHAIQVNIAIMRTFVQLRRLMDGNRDLARCIDAMDARYDKHHQNQRPIGFL
jgi:hypothetical protein